MPKTLGVCVNSLSRQAANLCRVLSCTVRCEFTGISAPAYADCIITKHGHTQNFYTEGQNWEVTSQCSWHQNCFIVNKGTQPRSTWRTLVQRSNDIAKRSRPINVVSRRRWNKITFVIQFCLKSMSNHQSYNKTTCRRREKVSNLIFQ